MHEGRLCGALAVLEGAAIGLDVRRFPAVEM